MNWLIEIIKIDAVKKLVLYLFRFIFLPDEERERREKVDKIISQVKTEIKNQDSDRLDEILKIASKGISK